MNRVDEQASINETQTTHYTYDKRGLVLQTIDAQQNKESYTYDANGNPIQTIDADGITTKVTYDKRNLVEQINTYAAGSDTPDKNATFIHDEEGNLVQSQDWTGNNTFEYDLLVSEITKVLLSSPGIYPSGETSRGIAHKNRRTYFSE